jgi:hypothetical protein
MRLSRNDSAQSSRSIEGVILSLGAFEKVKLQKARHLVEMTVVQQIGGRWQWVARMHPICMPNVPRFPARVPRAEEGTTQIFLETPKSRFRKS